jgi:GrpB-like predicted nucleotidyltransferase (UPF0157 family)
VNNILPSAAASGWQHQAEQERTRLLVALGAIPAGGIVQQAQHIGATAVPQFAGALRASTRIDLALSVAPFPLEERAVATLETLGYRPENVKAEETTEPVAQEQRFRHTSGEFCLYVIDSGSDRWMEHLLIRDLLVADEEARRLYQARRSEGFTPAAKAALFAELLGTARQWWIERHGFGPVQVIAQELDGCGFPWYIASGWALDLFLGRVTRVHHDVDVVVDRADQLRLRDHLAPRGWMFVTPLHGKLEPWPNHMRLELPRHQAHAHRDGEFIDFLLTEFLPAGASPAGMAGTGTQHGVWRYRRNPNIVRSTAQALLQTEQGLRYLAPEAVLLFKAKATGAYARSKDQIDFEQVYPHLSSEARAWLRWALIATEPGHPWIELLA